MDIAVTGYTLMDGLVALVGLAALITCYARIAERGIKTMKKRGNFCLHCLKGMAFGVVVSKIIQYNTMRYDTIQYNTILYNTMQYNTTQYNNNNTTLCNITQNNILDGKYLIECYSLLRKDKHNINCFLED